MKESFVAADNPGKSTESAAPVSSVSDQKKALKVTRLVPFSMQENRSEPDFKQGRTLYVQKSTANLLQWCFFTLPERNDKSLELLQIQQNKVVPAVGLEPTT
jgi:hypothetical protein